MTDTVVHTNGITHITDRNMNDNTVKEDGVDQPDVKKQKLDHTTTTLITSTSSTNDITNKLTKYKNELQRLNEWQISAEHELQYLQLMLQSQSCTDNTLSSQNDSMIDESNNIQPLTYNDYDKQYAIQLPDALKEPEPIIIPPRIPVDRITAVCKPAHSVITCEPYDINLQQLELQRKSVSDKIKLFQSTAGRLLPRSSEPSRNKTHWDYVLNEALWLAGDIQLEQKHKMRLAKLVVYDAQTYHEKNNTKQWQDICQQRNENNIEYNQRSNRIHQYWSHIIKLVYHKYNHTLPVVEQKRIEYAKQYYNKLKSESGATINKTDDANEATLASSNAHNNNTTIDSTNISVKQELTAALHHTNDSTATQSISPTTRRKRKTLQMSLHSTIGYKIDIIEEDDPTIKTDNNIDNITSTQLQQQYDKPFITPEHRLNLLLKDKQRLYRQLALQYHDKQYNVQYDLLPAPLPPPYDEYISNENIVIDMKKMMFCTPRDIARMMGPLNKHSLDQYSKPTLYKQSSYTNVNIKVSKDQYNQPLILRIKSNKIYNYKKRGFIAINYKTKQKQISTTNQIQMNNNNTINNNNNNKIAVTQSSKPQLPSIQPNTSSAVTNAAIIAMKQSVQSNSTGIKKQNVSLQIKPQTQRDVAECIRERVALIWTNGEDNLLLSLIGTYGMNWLIVSVSLGNIIRVSGRLRSARDCYYRHTLLTAARESNKHMSTAQASKLANDAHIIALQSIPQQVQQLQQMNQQLNTQGKPNIPPPLPPPQQPQGSKKQTQRTASTNSNNPISNINIPPSRNALSNLPKKDGLRDKQKRNNVSGITSHPQYNDQSNTLYPPSILAPSGTPREPLGYGGGIFNSIEAGMHKIKRDRNLIHHNLRASMPTPPHDLSDQQRVVNQQHQSHKLILMDAHSRMALPQQAMGKTLMPHQIIQLRMRRQQQLIQQHQAHQQAKEQARLQQLQQQQLLQEQNKQGGIPTQNNQSIPAVPNTQNHQLQSQQRYASNNIPPPQPSVNNVQPRPTSASGQQPSRSSVQQQSSSQQMNIQQPPLPGIPNTNGTPSPMPHNRTLSVGNHQVPNNSSQHSSSQQPHYSRTTPSPTPAVYTNQQQYNNNYPPPQQSQQHIPYNQSRGGAGGQTSPNQYPLTQQPPGRTSPIKPSSRGTSAHNANSVLSPPQPSQSLYNSNLPYSNQPPPNNQQYNTPQHQQLPPSANSYPNNQPTNYPPNYQQRTTSQNSQYSQQASIVPPPAAPAPQQYSARQPQQPQQQYNPNHPTSSGAPQQYNQPPPGYNQQSQPPPTRTSQQPQQVPYNNNVQYNGQQPPPNTQPRSSQPQQQQYIDSRNSPMPNTTTHTPNTNHAATNTIAPPDPVNERKVEQIVQYILQTYPNEQARVDEVLARRDVPAAHKLTWFQKLIASQQQRQSNRVSQ